MIEILQLNLKLFLALFDALGLVELLQILFQEAATIAWIRKEALVERILKGVREGRLKLVDKKINVGLSGNKLTKK